jgi:ribulose-phosphate 3-epimerase
MMKPCRVVPAILTADDQALRRMLRQAEEFTDYVQIDFMDGRFVPSHSILCENLSKLSTSLAWEAHLMVIEPEGKLDCLSDAGAQKAIFHFEATESPASVIDKARQLKLGIGLALNPETPLSSIVSLVTEVDSVLFLTVNPGYYGSEFLPEVLPKVTELRRLAPEVQIGVDGGIKQDNIARISRLGVDVIYVGSAIFMQPDPGQAHRNLLSLAQTCFDNGQPQHGVGDQSISDPGRY